MSIHATFIVLNATPNLTQEVTVQQLLQLISLSSQLKNDILVSQPPGYDPAKPPAVLPNNIRLFLSKISGIDLRFLDRCWSTVRSMAWEAKVDHIRFDDMDSEAWDVGNSYELSPHTLRPPIHHCLYCPNNSLLREHDPLHPATLHTLWHGPRPTFSSHLSCPGVPAIIEVSKYHYVERELAKLFVAQMVMSWTSATNASQIYNTLYSSTSTSSTTSLTDDHIWNAFIILSLIRDSGCRKAVLAVLDSGAQNDRFNQAMSERNQRIAEYGQDLINHYCDRCLKVTEKEDGKHYKIHALVANGICIGHPRCAFQDSLPCKNPLSSSKDWFCTLHQDENQICAITLCRHPVVAGFLTCDDPEHCRMENNRSSCQKAMFQLKHVLACQGIVQTANSQELNDIPNDDVERTDGPDAPGPSTIFVEDSKDCLEKEDNRNLKAIFGRLRTHAELVFHRPCGIMVHQTTCLRAEILTQVLEELHWFRDNDLLPEVCFYNNNCRLYCYLNAHDDPIKDELCLPVDPFHWKCKHKKTDIEFTELREDTEDQNGKWVFNSSVAEQNNVWLGGYLALVREMGFVKYNFFLDEMIRRKNEMILAKLAKSTSPGLFVH
ncbi:hypothetical protein BT96DRAFT_1080003 [Gymnopus androsaceus JB14]|uniref:CxC6 like cysteine cluster associated with KDZ domain-containing protein n=1 Tax=Gymnopus androsaceus JB14 TaxID=1447944 RepID=A0A6A4HW29_9AGAR|nr:hypothetical protein BT96DRAFT_1080003 [Gymnopus androsaceus JB14]